MGLLQKMLWFLSALAESPKYMCLLRVYMSIWIVNVAIFLTEGSWVASWTWNLQWQNKKKLLYLPPKQSLFPFSSFGVVSSSLAASQWRMHLIIWSKWCLAALLEYNEHPYPLIPYVCTLPGGAPCVLWSTDISLSPFHSPAWWALYIKNSAL